MTRISYLNGEFLEHDKCFIHIEDRGFQFGDGAYEVTLFRGGKLVDIDSHMKRLFRSLGELNIEHELKAEDLIKIHEELFKLNNLDSGFCYLQVTRGNHNRMPFCPKGLKPTIVASVSKAKVFSDEEFENGILAMTHDDIRWKRCDIKSVALLPATLMNQKAKDLGFNDTIFVRDGFVTEATFANCFIVDKDNNLITRPADNFILCGITRNRIIDLAKKRGINVIEKKFSVDELIAAKEVFLTSSTLILRPVTKIDDNIIASGKAGEIAAMLKKDYLDFLAVS